LPDLLLVSGGRRLLGRAVDLTVFAPIGLAVAVSRCAGRVVNDVQRRVADRIIVARTVGQLAVQVGGRRLRDLFDDRHGAVDPEPIAPPAVVTPLRVIEDATSFGDTAADATELPIDEYESLAASQVVARLTALDAQELALVERFERANRRRRTVLGKIEQLQRA
jgi:hypothetical protein